MNQTKMNLKSLDIRLVALFLFVLAIVIRFMPHFYNVAAIGALAMFVGCYWSARIGFLMSIAAMGISDMLGHWLEVPSMGFYNPLLMLTVYGAIGCAAGVGRLIQSSKRVWQVPMLAAVPLGALASTAIFFLVTNFASWLDPQMAYANSLSGLVECYVAALPFAKNTLIGNLVFSSLFFGAYHLLTAKSSARELSPAEVRSV